MTPNAPPRHVPTLTEVVSRPAVKPLARPTAVHLPSANVPVSSLDRTALAQEVIAQVRPQLEAELRSIALELFEAQFNTLLPSLQLQIEEAVREAIERKFPDHQQGPV